jgi:hypothetical protein
MNVVDMKRFVRSLKVRVGMVPAYRGYGPMPPSVKINALKRVFVPGVVIETGTYYGDTTAALAKAGFAVHTIEVSRSLASRVFPGLRRQGIHCYSGDSGVLIGQIIETVLAQNSHLNFWLDGHWCDGVTSKAADYETPILQELDTISRFRDKCQKLVVAIDDVRCFGNDPAYPPRRFLTDWADAYRLRAYYLTDIFVASTETYRDL